MPFASVHLQRLTIIALVFFMGLLACSGKNVSRPATLSVVVTGTGSGTLVSDPAGIDCGALCAAAFARDSDVELRASASDGSVFVGYGDRCSGTSDCIVHMSEDATVVARFDLTFADGGLE